MSTETTEISAETSTASIEKSRDSRETHRVAVVVMCEAMGVDERDASRAAEMAIGHLVRTHKADAQHLVGSAGPPTCAVCGVHTSLDVDGLVRRHISCETWSPEEFNAENPDSPRVEACEGSEQPPRPPDEPVIGYMRGDLPIYARVHEILDAGMAFGNGYLWARPTAKAYRR